MNSKTIVSNLLFLEKEIDLVLRDPSDTRLFSFDIVREKELEKKEFPPIEFCFGSYALMDLAPWSDEDDMKDPLYNTSLQIHRLVRDTRNGPVIDAFGGKAAVKVTLQEACHFLVTADKTKTYMFFVLRRGRLSLDDLLAVFVDYKPISGGGREMWEFTSVNPFVQFHRPYEVGAGVMVVTRRAK